ncbi:MAG: hypothetical protein HY073_04435 [Deltaproteobacteria bacterium]|nr:hypothetical protein [Deltaproteobacteria bacterium]
MTSKDKLIKFVDLNAFITIDEAKKIGVSPMMLSRFVNSEELFRTERGIYTRDLNWLTDPLKKYIAAYALYPQAVICSISALTYYNLTDAEEKQIWIALPAPKIIHSPRYRVIRPSGISYTLGIEKHFFGKRVVKMYDLEKTIVDAFKYNTEEIALKALKGYLKRKDKNITKLCSYGRQLRKPLDEIVTILQADE